MKAEIIVIGDEILIGDTLDSNSSWLAGKLDGIGIETRQITTIGDDESQILNTLEAAFSRADVVVITGGLGPTHDDITKQTLVKYFKDELIYNEIVYKDLENLLKKFGRQVESLNKQQAMVPSKCEIIRNSHGTAPGMLFKKGEKIVISLPGVPHEMKAMMEGSVPDDLAHISGENHRVHRYLKTFGIAEADLSTKLNPLTDQLPSAIRLAFLPSPGHVKLRFTADTLKNKGVKKSLDRLVSEYKKQIGFYWYGGEDDTLQSLIGKLLSRWKLTLSTAESCTGGSLASRITGVSGSSAYFKGTVVSYSNEVKTDVLGVEPSLIAEHGAVSEEVAKAMAVGVRELMHTDYALSTSGIAGPDGGTDEKPVGTIWLALSGKQQMITKKLQLGFDRKTNISLTTDHALNLLRKELIERFD